MSYPVICIDLGNRHYTDVVIVPRMPAIGKPFQFLTFQAAEVKMIEPATIPPQRFAPDADQYDFFTVTYRPLNLVEDHTKLIASKRCRQSGNLL